MRKRQFATNLRVDTISTLKMMAIENNCNANDIIESLLQYYKKIENLKSKVNDLDNYELVKILKSIKI